MFRSVAAVIDIASCRVTGFVFATLAEDCQGTLSVGRMVLRWGDALAESFFAPLKGELIDRWPWPSGTAAHGAIVEYSGGHNGTRPHITLDYLSLAEFEATNDQETIGQVA